MKKNRPLYSLLYVNSYSNLDKNLKEAKKRQEIIKKSSKGGSPIKLIIFSWKILYSVVWQQNLK